MAKLTRAEIARIVGNDPKLISAFETIQQGAIDAAEAISANVAETQGIGNATVVTLSPNDAFDNEYILQVAGLTLTAKDGKVTIGLPLTLNGPGRLVLNRVADTILTLPTGGTLATTTPPGPYADDATAASNGVNVGEWYAKTGGMVAWRVS